MIEAHTCLLTLSENLIWRQSFLFKLAGVLSPIWLLSWHLIREGGGGGTETDRQAQEENKEIKEIEDSFTKEKKYWTYERKKQTK